MSWQDKGILVFGGMNMTLEMFFKDAWSVKPQRDQATKLAKMADFTRSRMNCSSTILHRACSDLICLVLHCYQAFDARPQRTRWRARRI